jgi:hypothetical protein
LKIGSPLLSGGGSLKRQKEKLRKRNKENKLDSWAQDVLAKHNAIKAKKIKRKAKQTKEHDLGYLDGLRLAVKERKRRKKRGVKLTFLTDYYFKLRSHKATWITKHLLDEKGELRFWGLDREIDSPKRRELTNGDYSPEDWIYNPPVRKTPAVWPRNKIIRDTLARVLGWKSYRAKEGWYAADDWKAALKKLHEELARDKADWLRPIYGSVAPPRIVPRKPPMVIKIVNEKKKYMFRRFPKGPSEGEWVKYFTTRRQALKSASRSGCLHLTENIKKMWNIEVTPNGRKSISRWRFKVRKVPS